jgi:hypothetical protein
MWCYSVGVQSVARATDDDVMPGKDLIKNQFLLKKK